MRVRAVVAFRLRPGGRVSRTSEVVVARSRTRAVGEPARVIAASPTAAPVRRGASGSAARFGPGHRFAQCASGLQVTVRAGAGATTTGRKVAATAILPEQLYWASAGGCPARTVGAMTPIPVLLAVDGNSLVHRSFHALQGSNLHTDDGKPTWAVKGFLSQLVAAAGRAGVSEIVVGFDDATSSVRKAQYPDYKAGRPTKSEDLTKQLEYSADVCRAMGIAVVVPAGLEADDVLASAVASARSAGWRSLLVTSDRDSFALIDEYASVLRVLNGGIGNSPILTPERLAILCGVRPEQYRQYAAVRGDTSDNLPGIRGVGKKTAARLLERFNTMEMVFADVDSDGGRVRAEFGPAMARKLADEDGRLLYERNMSLMAMHTDQNIGVTLDPNAAAAPLNLDRHAVERTLHAWQMKSLIGDAITVLTCDETPSDADSKQGATTGAGAVAHAPGAVVGNYGASPFPAPGVGAVCLFD